MGSAGNLKRLLCIAALVGIGATLVGVPLAGSVNPDINDFELDGNAAGGGANDWDALGSPLEFTGFIADPTDSSDRGYTTGGSKDTRDISEWRWEDGNVTPDKDNIANAYSAVYSEDSNLILYFGQNRQLDESGDANVGFWFTQSQIGLNGDGTFSGTHQDGDILVQSEFTNGGDVSGIRIGKWQGGSLQILPNGAAECADGKLGTKDACAIVNKGTISTSWAGDITSPYFFEGGLNLTALFGNQVPCFSTFLTNTRTSQSETAQLKDFAMGDIDTCASIKISKVATPSDGSQFGYSTTGGLNPSGFSLGDGGSQTYGSLQPGQYSVSELAPPPPAGWAFYSLSCPSVSGPGTSVQIDGMTVNITLGFLGNVECTYVNKRKPQVKVVKALDPTSDTGTFDLQINGTTHADDVGHGGSTGFKEVDPGQVTVGELAGTGTNLSDYVSSVSCDSEKGSADGTSHSFSVGYGDVVTCTITNQRKGKIIVEKQTNPAGATQLFSFTPSYGAGFQLSDGQQNESGLLAPGNNYSVFETVPSGWTLTSQTCDDGSSPAAIDLDAGETVKCTFVNAKHGQVIVKKVMVGGTDTFAYEGTPSGSISVNNGTISQAVAPGQYVSTEDEKDGWDLTSISCNDANSSGDVPNRQATFNVEPGETVTCTFTNRKQGQVIVKKVMVGGTDTFDYTGTPNGSISENNGTISQAVTPGQYLSTEAAKAGWILTSIECDDANSTGNVGARTATFNVAAGETVTCTFTNTKQGEVIVKKVMVGGTDTFDYTGTPNGSISVNEGTISANVAPGQYLSTEAVKAGWNLTSISCDDANSSGSVANRRATFNVEAGETVTCTFTNTKQGQVIVEKVMVGGTDTFNYTGTPSGSISQSGGTISANVAPGQYVSTEAAKAGWDLTSIECDDANSFGSVASRQATFNVEAGETVTCTFTNTKRGRIIVEKQTNPNGATQLFSFTASYDADGFSLSDGQQNNSGLLPAGEYSVSETVPAGWDLESSVCDDQSDPDEIDLAPGETVTCVFTNEKDAVIIVEKQTDPNGATQSFAFTASYDDDGFSLSDGQQNNSGDLDPDVYSVSETVPAGWDLTSAVCSDQSDPNAIGLAAGETVTCVFTNTKRGSIIVEKQTVPNGDPQLFSFTASYDANGFSLSDGDSNDSGNLEPGTYSVDEVVPAGWDLTSAVCSDQSDPDAIDLDAGETVTCVFTNTKRGRIIVEKQTDPNGHQQVFDFDASYDLDGFSLSDGQQNNSGYLEPDTYSVSEVVPAGWDLTSAVCSDQSDPDEIDLDPGETVTCVFTNTLRRGQIIVQKQTDPNGDPQLFAFTASYDADGFMLSDGQSNNSGALLPGTYSVSETVPAGWDLASKTCDDGSAPDAIDLDAGETVTCVFNNEKDAFIIVEKQTNPDGDPQSFSFDASYDVNGFSLSDGQSNNSGDLSPGTYSVSENVPAGWDLESSVCSDQSDPDEIELAAGETVTCVFTNEKDAVIIVEKQTDPDGHAQSFDFNASYDESGFSLSDGQSNNSGDLEPGTYSVSENVPDGWDLVSSVCSDGSPKNAIVVSAGETVTCVFTNKLRRGQIIVEKQTNPDGDPQAFSFAASYDANGFSLKDGESDNSGDLLPGKYSVSENVPAGWDLVSSVCSDQSDPDEIDLAPGETVTCVFTNEKDAVIIVEKQTNPNADPQVFDFDASYDANGFSLSDGQQNNSGDLDPGTYSVSENVVPQGWTLESAVCDDESDPSEIHLAAGETVTCVFTNTKRGSIIVEKQTNPNGDPQAFDFDASYDEGGFSLSDGESNDSGELDPGTYSVSENVPDGWDLTSAVCSDESDPEAIQLAAGETVTCVFTNTKLGTIIVEKQTSPNGAAGSFTYSGDAAGSIGDGGQIVVTDLDPGTYASTEGPADGWSLTSISCDDANSTGSVATRAATFRLEAGETVKCVFTNAKLATGLGSIEVSKSANPTSVQEPGGLVTFSVTIRNTSPDVDASITNVVDNVFGDLDDDGGNGCFDVPVNLAPGQTVNCTFQRQITGTGGSSHINTVTASGHDEFLNPLSDSDDAKVDITPRLIDLVIVKEASSPTPLNGIVNYRMTVTNKGPDAATNVQLADPAPAGITYLSANPSQGTCSVSAALITCSLGTIAPGQTVTIAVTARATQVGTHTNTATVTGSGGRETNPADNVDSAVTVVPAPVKPPVAKPKPPAPEVCLTLVVSPKMITADGKPEKVTVKTLKGKKRVRGIKVLVSGAGVRKSARSNGKGVAVLRINPRKAGLITITALETGDQKVCGAKRIGVVGVFLPPLTG